MAIRMGFPSLEYGFKRHYRYIFSIPEVCGLYPDDGLYCKIHEKTARPNISYKEIQMEHLGQTIYFPGKVNFDAIGLTLWDNIADKGQSESDNNPVWQWLNQWYDFYEGKYQSSNTGFKKTCSLKLYDGCGCIVEEWIYENAWPISVNFGDLDMGSSAICTIDLQLRYDLAYLA